MLHLHAPLDESLREALSPYDDLTAALLARRGVRSKDEAEAFLNPNFEEHIHDPMLLKDMPKAAARLAKAIATGEKIAVWSDYDCDGIPGAVILHDFLKKTRANFINYIPHRHREGYGMNESGLELLALQGVTLVVSVDVGIVDIAAVAYANNRGMEVIITDHHLPGPELPDAYAVVNHKQEGETYPFRELCGGALAWKLVCATLAHGFPGRENIPVGWEKWLLDMAGLATIADMVPLVGENRVLAHYGLLVMRKSSRIGLQKLCKAARLNQRFITEDDIGFTIAPRVNAASRMGEPMDAFHLFTTTDEVEAERLAATLEKVNRSRRAAAGAITKAVHARLLGRTGIPSVIAMGDPEWRPGLLGLVANTIAEEYARPVFLWGREASGLIKGSCRAGRGDVHVVELMRQTPETFIEFGGHAKSGGFSVIEEAVFFLEDRLSKTQDTLPEFSAQEEEFADVPVAPEDATSELLSRFNRLAPFGMGNPKPVVLIEQAILLDATRFGKAQEHLKLRLNRSGTPLEAVAFYAKSDTLPARGATVSVLGNLERDTFSRGAPVRIRLLRFW